MRIQWIVVRTLVVSMMGLSLSLALGADPNTQIVRELVYADMEVGRAPSNAWFQVPGRTSQVARLTSELDSPLQVAGTRSLGVEFRLPLDTGNGFRGDAGQDLGGFGKRRLVDVADLENFNFWIKPLSADSSFFIVVGLQVDVDGNGRFDPLGVDREFRFRCRVAAEDGCASSANPEWQRVSVSLSSFIEDRQTGLVGDRLRFSDSPIKTVASVVVRVEGNVAPGLSFRTDHWTFSGAIPPDSVFDEFSGTSDLDWEQTTGLHGSGGIIVGSEPVGEGDSNHFLGAGWQQSGEPGAVTRSYGGFMREMTGPAGGDSYTLPTDDPWMSYLLRVADCPVDGELFELLITLVVSQGGGIAQATQLQWSQSYDCSNLGPLPGDWVQQSAAFSSFAVSGQPLDPEAAELMLFRLDVELISDHSLADEVVPVLDLEFDRIVFTSGSVVLFQPQAQKGTLKVQQ